MKKDLTTIPAGETDDEGRAVGLNFAQAYFDRLSKAGESDPSDLFRIVGLLDSDARREGFCSAVQAVLVKLGALYLAQAAVIARKEATLDGVRKAALKAAQIAQNLQTQRDNPPVPIRTDKIVQFVFDDNGAVIGAAMTTPSLAPKS